MTVFGLACRKIQLVAGQIDYQSSDIWYVDKNNLEIRVLYPNGEVPARQLTEGVDYIITAGAPVLNQPYVVYKEADIKLLKDFGNNYDKHLLISRTTPVIQDLSLQNLWADKDWKHEAKLDDIVKMIQELYCKGIDYWSNLGGFGYNDGVYFIEIKNGTATLLSNFIPDPSKGLDGQLLFVDNGKLVYKDISKFLPSQTGNIGKQLITDGNKVLWQTQRVPDPTTGTTGQLLFVDNGKLSYKDISNALPPQSGNVDKHLVTDGNNALWQTQRVPDPKNAVDGQILEVRNGALTLVDDKAERNFDVSNGLLGTCEIEVLPSNTSLKIDFTGKAVFCEDTDELVNTVTPQGETQFDLVSISTADFTYIYLDKSGNVISSTTKEDNPRDKILLATAEHTDRTNVSHLYNYYTSSNVDAHRIKDIWKSYRPTVIGAVVKVTDNTSSSTISISQGIFFKYCSDTTKQYDNHFVEIPSIPVADFLYRSLEPKDYTQDWAKDDSQLKSNELIEGKLIDAKGNIKALNSGYVTFYPVFLNANKNSTDTKVNVLLGVPEISIPKTAVNLMDGEGLFRDYLYKIDKSLLEDYALIGYISCANENGNYSWSYGTTIDELRGQFIKDKGNAYKIAGVTYSASLIEQKGGVIYQYDPTTYLIGERGEMEDYPVNWTGKISRNSFNFKGTMTDNTSLDPLTTKQVGLHNIFDKFWSNVNVQVTDTNYIDYRLSTGTVIIPSVGTNVKIPPVDIFKITHQGGSNDGDNVDIEFSPKISTGTLNLTVTFLDDPNNTPFKFDNYIDKIGRRSYFLIFRFPTKVQITTSNIDNYLELSPIIKNSFDISISSTQSRLSNTDYKFRNSIEFLFKPGVDLTTDQLYGATVKLKDIHLENIYEEASQSLPYRKYDLYSMFYSERKDIADTRTITNKSISLKWDIESNLPLLHTRLSTGQTLSDLNVGPIDTDHGDGKFADLVPGDVVINLEIKSDTNKPIQEGTYWHCDLKHELLLPSLPVIILYKGNDRISAEVSKVISWNRVRYIFRGLTQDQIDNWILDVRINGNNDFAAINTHSEFWIGASMATDAYSQ